MKRKMLVFAIALCGAAFGASAQSQTTVKTTTVETTTVVNGYVTVQPPIPVVTRTTIPGQGYVWLEEDWVWNPNTSAYEWSGGKWIKGEGEKRWYKGKWKKDDKGYVWMKGSWR